MHLRRLLGVVLVVGLLPIGGASASILGKACAPVKAVKVVAGTRFVCTKVAGKLVWKTSPVAPKPRQLDTSALGTFSTPVVPAGYLQLMQAIAAQPDPDLTNLQFIVDPDVPPSTVELAKSKIKLVVRALEPTLPPLKMPIRIYFYNTKNFAALAELLRADLTTEALYGGWLDAKTQRAAMEPDYFYGGAAPGYGKDGAPVLVYYLNKNSLAAYDVLQAFGHEYIHVYQRNALRNMARMTCWIREGQATYLGYTLAAKEAADFRNAWLGQYRFVRSEPSTADFFAKTAADWQSWLVEQETRQPTECDDFSNYLYGSIVWSYLYGTYGVLKTNTFFATIANYPMPTVPPGDAWKQAFLKVFGETPATAYPKIAQFMATEAVWVGSALG